MTNSGKTYKILYSDVAFQDAKQLPKTIQKRVSTAITTKLTVAPHHFGKPLRYSLSGNRRLRVGDYRVVYQIHEAKKTVLILAMQHRKNIYEEY